MILQQKKQNKQRLQNVNVDAWQEFRFVEKLAVSLRRSCAFD